MRIGGVTDAPPRDRRSPDRHPDPWVLEGRADQEIGVPGPARRPAVRSSKRASRQDFLEIHEISGAPALILWIRESLVLRRSLSIRKDGWAGKRREKRAERTQSGERPGGEAREKRAERTQSGERPGGKTARKTVRTNPIRGTPGRENDAKNCPNEPNSRLGEIRPIPGLERLCASKSRRPAAPNEPNPGPPFATIAPGRGRRQASFSPRKIIRLGINP